MLYLVNYILVVAILLVIIGFVCTQTDCIISINEDTTEPQPLILKSNYAHTHNLNAIILPDVNEFITIKRKTKVSFHCPDSQLFINTQATNVSWAIATCAYNKTFVLLERQANISNITCQRYPAHTARDTGKTCLRKYKQIDLGIELHNGKFLKHIEVCYDDVLQVPLYTTFKMTRYIAGGQHGTTRPNFLSTDVNQDFKHKQLYSRRMQRRTINKLVGLDANSTKYINDWNYLARGHLTARADFVYAAQQRVTFYYVNAAPQWQTFNGANWNLLEMFVRRFASEKGVDLQIYTGTHGVTSLPKENATELQVPLYLYTDVNNNQAVPVPELFWKVIHNTKDKSGVAIVGVNNPYQTDIKPICKDVCNEITWIKWKKPKNITLGYCYCCSVHDFRKSVQTFPLFQVNKLLT